MSLLEELRQDATLKGRLERNRFVVLLFGVIAIAVVLVTIAMSVYNSSGAAQLDLSSPRYISVRNKVVQDKSTAAFSSSGPFDQKTFDEFFKAYDEHANAVKQINGYDPSAVNNDSFNLVPLTPPEPAQ